MSPRPTHLCADAALAARIEAAEADLIRAGAESRPAGQPAYVRPLAGGLAVHTVEGSPLDKLVGMGFGAALVEAELAQVEADCAARGAASVRVELATLAEPAIGELLTARGYRLVGFENVLGRALPAEPSAATEVELEASTDGDLEAWIDVVVTGFANPDTQGAGAHDEFPRDVLEAVIRDMAKARGCTRYLARRGGQLAGGASMRTHGGVATLTGAATLPDHRRRGVQSALLAYRLGAAWTAGCDLAVVTTQPGSKSQQNVQKLGFGLLYARAVLVRSLPAG